MTCGVDIGSTNTKVVALDESGVVVARSSRPTPRDAIDLSIDAAGLFDAIEDMIIEACGDRFSVNAVAVAGVGEDGVLVDGAAQPLTRVLAWFDPRRERIYRELLPELEPVEGLPVESGPSRTIVGWRWSAKQTGVGAATSWVALTDYASARWSGRAFMSDTLAARTAAWTPEHRAWIGSRVDVTLRDRNLLPDVLYTGERVGALVSPRLEAAGVLAPDAVVVAGGHDHPIGGWGVNQLRARAVLDSMGTAEVVVAQSPRPLAAHTEGLDIAPGILQPGSSLLFVQELARNMDWAAQDTEVGIALRAIVAGELEPDAAVGSDAFIPGGTGGATPSYAVDAPTNPASRASAVAGALAMAGERAIDRVAGHVGPDTKAFAAGGWARSPGWIRLKENLTGRAITVIPEPEVTAVGAALLAAQAVGWSPSAERALSPAGNAI